MIIENKANREGYYGVMISNEDDTHRDSLAVIFIWGKHDGTNNYITVTDFNGTKVHKYDSFAEAMQSAIRISKQY